MGRKNDDYHNIVNQRSQRDPIEETIPDLLKCPKADNVVLFIIIFVF